MPPWSQTTEENKEEKKRQDTLSRLKVDAEMKKSAVLAEQHERLLGFIADHKKDVSMYDFRCERYGDFLAVFITRGEEKERQHYWQTDSNKIVSALSLMQSREIKLTEGRAPDNSGHANFKGMQKINAEKQRTDEWEAQIEYSAPEYKRLLVLDALASESMGMYSCGRSYYDFLGVSLDGLAQAAKDDTIRINGCGATIFAPFGLGQAVYDKILKAIKAK